KLDSDIELEEVVITDPRFGNLLSATDYSGEQTRFEYDPLGRLTAIYKPGDADDAPTVSYQYRAEAPLSRIVTRSRFGSAERDFEETQTLTDGLGRKRGALTRAGDDE